MNEEEKNKFRLKKRLHSFGYAFRGIGYLLKTQHNAWIHLVLTLTVVGMGLLFHINSTEWMVIVLCIGLVLGAEAMNTAIEVLCDARFPEKDKRAEIIKDTAAGAVLLVAMAAATCGLIIFLPRIILLFS